MFTAQSDPDCAVLIYFLEKLRFDIANRAQKG